MLDDRTITRREWLVAFGRTTTAMLALSALVPEQLYAEGRSALTVYKDPGCACCTKWVAHLRANGLVPEVHDRSDMDALKDSLGIPTALRSCHTAVAGRYLIEGHVPAADIKRLLATSPKGVLGLAVPDMPVGSPGMEMGGRADRYQVLAFDARGATHPFATH